MAIRFFFVAAAAIVMCSDARADHAFPVEAKRILFLGDSITHAGHYISMVEAQLLLVGDDSQPELINLGLPSETCSGLSEPEHPFPRPDVHERLDRALQRLKPDVVVACYGMNDGIYYPFGEERFKAYRDGVNQIIDKVHAADAKLVLMTPPAFDPLPLRTKGKLLPLGAEKYSWKAIYEDYDQVMRRYADWIVAQADRVEMVIDLHSAVTDYVLEKRSAEPSFTMSPDGVHVDKEGHAVIAAAIVEAWKLGRQITPEEGLMTLISRRQQLMHNAWLSEVGHQRPGVKDGLPIEQAKTEAQEIGKQIRARVLRQRDAETSQHDDVLGIHFPASAKDGELSLFVDYFLWIPPGVQNVRGIILHQHGCGPGASAAGLTAANDLHWRSLAKKWDCALMGSSYEGRAGELCRLWCDPRNGSAKRFLEALDKFAVITNQPEISEVPWCLWGHSGGGFWASLMQTMYPERIAAIWLQSGTAYQSWESGEIEGVTLADAVYEIPVMACPGEKEKGHERFHRAWEGSQEMFKAYRAKNAPFGIAVDPRTGHECGDSRYLAIPFFDECLSLRLPPSGSTSRRLRPIDLSTSYLGSGQQVVSAESFDGDPTTMVWLPGESFAGKWLDFVTTGVVDDSTPPSAPDSGSHSVDERGVQLSWDAEADLESGLRGFRITRDGETVAELPGNPKGRFGRPVFQAVSYSDTPEQPLMKMVWQDDAEPAETRYEIYSINGVGLESQPLVMKVE